MILSTIIEPTKKEHKTTNPALPKLTETARSSTMADATPPRVRAFLDSAKAIINGVKITGKIYALTPMKYI